MADNSVDLKYDLDATREDVRAAIDRLKKNERSYWRSKARALYQQVIAENWYGAAAPPPKGTLRSVDVLRENLMYYNLTLPYAHIFSRPLDLVLKFAVRHADSIS